MLMPYPGCWFAAQHVISAVSGFFSKYHAFTKAEPVTPHPQIPLGSLPLAV